jgi:hypothetical protein
MKNLALEVQDRPTMRTALRNAAAQPNLERIGPGLDKYSIDENVDFEANVNGLDAEFRYQQVEHLLDQAADLLDRGIKDRQLWHELYEQWFTSALAIRELLAVESVQELEEDAGAFKVQPKISAADASAAKDSDAFLQKAAAECDSILVNLLSEGNSNELIEVEAALAVFGLIDSTGRQGIGVPQLYYPTDIGDSLQTKTIRAVRRLARHRHSMDIYAALVSKLQLQASAAANAARLEALRFRSDYDAQDQGFRERRREIEREVTAAKWLATALPGGALNYGTRMTPVRERYVNDFTQAWARLKVAARGLALLFGYIEPLPTPDQGNRKFFDDCLLWVRRAISYIVQSARLDQQFVVTISTRQLSGANWQSGLTTGVWPFKIRRETLPIADRIKHARLRGASLFVTGDGAVDTWSGEVCVPRSSEIYHKDGAVKALDQSSVPPCLVGRISGRNANRAPELVGTAVWFNASPFGEWEIKLNPQSAEGSSLNTITDVHLELLLSARVLP